MRVIPEVLAAKQEAMRRKMRGRRLKRLSQQLVGARAAQRKNAPRELVTNCNQFKTKEAPIEAKSAPEVVTTSDRKLLWGRWANLYENGHTIEKIAAAHKVSTNRVWYGLSRGGVRMRSQGERPVVKAAPQIDMRVRVHGDIPAEKLDRMEALAYRIARRKWQKCL